MALTGQTILVTGASSGIGRETAILLSKLGAKVVASGRNQERLEQTMSLLPMDGHLSCPFDLGKADDVPSWMRELSIKVGPLTGLAHCAGTELIRPLRFLSTQDSHAVFETNFFSALQLAKGFRQKGVCQYPGSIVFISSVAGLVGEAAASAYGASKAALIGLTRALAVELAPEKIRVNCVAPGLVRTEMYDRMQTIYTPEQMKHIESQHPIGIGTPEDVANAMAFLLSPASRWITGTTLVVDGGYTAH